jgi:hypothetical protein
MVADHDRAQGAIVGQHADHDRAIEQSLHPYRYVEPDIGQLFFACSGAPFMEGGASLIFPRHVRCLEIVATGASLR